MKHTLLSLITLLFVAAGSVASADTIPGPAGSNVTVYSPKGWKTQAAEDGGNAILVAVSPKDDAALLYAVVTAKDADAALAIVDGVLGKMVKDVQIKQGGKTKVDGMPALALVGTGTSVDDGKPVSLGAVIVKTNDDHMLFAVGIAQSDRQSAYKKEFKKALAGIKRSAQ